MCGFAHMSTNTQGPEERARAMGGWKPLDRVLGIKLGSSTRAVHALKLLSHTDSHSHSDPFQSL